MIYIHLKLIVHSYIVLNKEFYGQSFRLNLIIWYIHLKLIVHSYIVLNKEFYSQSFRLNRVSCIQNADLLYRRRFDRESREFVRLTGSSDQLKLKSYDQVWYYKEYLNHFEVFRPVVWLLNTSVYCLFSSIPGLLVSII